MKFEITNIHSGVLNLKLRKDNANALTQNLGTIQVLPGKNKIEMSEAEYKQVKRPLDRWEKAGKLVVKQIVEKVEAPKAENLELSDDSEEATETPKRSRRKRQPIGE